MKRFGVEAFVDAFGLTETCAPILSPYGEIRPPGAAGLLAADWFEARLVDPDTDEEVPGGQLGELVVRYKHPWTCSLGYYGMPDKTAEAWRTGGSTPGTRCAVTRKAGTTSSTGTRTRYAAAARTSAPTRSSRPSWPTRRCRSAR